MTYKQVSLNFEIIKSIFNIKMENDAAVNHIFEMVKKRMDEEKPTKKKRRKRTFTPEQRARNLRNLAKGRETLRKRREAKKAQMKLEVRPVKKEVVKPVKVEVKPVVKEEVKPVVNEVVAPKPVVHKRVVPQPKSVQVVDTEPEVFNFGRGGSFW